jgi:lysophospholipase L1-like esterase
MLSKTQWLIIGGISIVVVGVITFMLLKTKNNLNVSKPKLKNKNPKKILIAGDSQSAIKTASGKNITFTYPNILMKNLPNVKIDVLAIGGKTSAWLLQNLPNQLKKEKYDRIYIYIGGNDTSNASIKLETTLSNIQKMVDLGNNNGADVFVNLGYKVEGTAGKFGNYKIMNLTRYLKKQEDWIPYIEKRKELQRLIPKTIIGANFIPIYDLNKNTNDGIHPNSIGHKIVADKFMDSIQNFK